jgi:hypothetical protein
MREAARQDVLGRLLPAADAAHHVGVILDPALEIEVAGTGRAFARFADWFQVTAIKPESSATGKFPRFHIKKALPINHLRRKFP